MTTPEAVHRHQTRCLHCEHPVSGTSQQAIAEGLVAHAEFVVATVDHQTDPHFEDARLLALIAL